MMPTFSVSTRKKLPTRNSSTRRSRPRRSRRTVTSTRRQASRRTDWPARRGLAAGFSGTTANSGTLNSRNSTPASANRGRRACAAPARV